MPPQAMIRPCTRNTESAASRAELFFGLVGDNDDQQDHHYYADHRPKPHPSARPSTHPSVSLVHHVLILSLHKRPGGIPAEPLTNEIYGYDGCLRRENLLLFFHACCRAGPLLHQTAGDILAATDFAGVN